jgi:A/G-specific adenine glycosylase
MWGGLFSFVFPCENLDMTLAEKKRLFNKTLFAWHKKGYRDMPWRDTFDPYHILISEIMLQQTQVDRVRTKYAEFLKKFPTVQVLARVPLGEVLRVWSGLGYNRRAKYLHECAKKVTALSDGKFPETYNELVLLPGIGMSTAGALLAFAYAHETPMIDTNIRRILTRVFFRQQMSRPRLDIKVVGRGFGVPSDKELYKFAQAIIPKGKGRMWNYAMLDLGATLCTARNHSDLCPLMKLHGKVGDFAYKKPQRKFKDSRRYYRGQILKLLSVQRSLHVDVLPELLRKTPEEVAEILDDLVKERLVSVHALRISLPH